LLVQQSPFGMQMVVIPMVQLWVLPLQL